MLSPSTQTEVGAWMSEQKQGCYITSELAKRPDSHNAICMLDSLDPGKTKPSSVFVSFSMI